MYAHLWHQFQTLKTYSFEQYLPAASFRAEVEQAVVVAFLAAAYPVAASLVEESFQEVGVEVVACRALVQLEEQEEHLQTADEACRLGTEDSGLREDVRRPSRAARLSSLF